MMLLLVLVLLALIFGVGAVIEGIAWALLIGIVLLAAAAWMGYQRFRDFSRSS